MYSTSATVQASTLMTSLDAELFVRMLSGLEPVAAVPSMAGVSPRGWGPAAGDVGVVGDSG